MQDIAYLHTFAPAATDAVTEEACRPLRDLTDESAVTHRGAVGAPFRDLVKHVVKCAHLFRNPTR